MRPATASFLKQLPIAPLLDQFRDWYSLRQMKHQTSFAQHGEDTIVLEYFNRRPGFYIDVGANHPFRISNTYLLYLNGWRGITLEPLPHLSQKHRRYRPEDWHFNVGAGSREGSMRFYEMTPNVLSTFDEKMMEEYIKTKVGVLASYREIPVRTIASVWKELQLQQGVDFLSIDCEGSDLDVLHGVDWSVMKPKLLSVETVHEEAGGEIHRFLREMGFRVLGVRGCNTLFEFAG